MSTAKKKARVRPIRDERGRARGFTIESHDGRQAAVVRPAPIRAKLSIKGDR